MQVKVIAPAPSQPRELLRVAAYCRVSTGLESQETSFAAQCEHYRACIQANPGWQFAGVYADHGVSATGSADRSQLRRLLEDCEQGRVDFVLTKSISRFARNTAECLAAIRRLQAMGVSVLFEQENIHTGREESEFVLGIFAALAAEESRSISRNVKWGIRRRFEAGTYRHARPPYGYRRGEAGLEIYEPEARVVRGIYAQLLSGDGTYLIARRLNQSGVPTSQGAAQWDPKTVLELVQNPAYRGDLLYQKTYRDEGFHQQPNRGVLDMYMNHDCHRAIIDREDFRLANELIHRRGRNRAPSAGSNCFTGKIICGACGGTMHRCVRYGGLAHFFRCKTKRNSENSCNSPNIPEDSVKIAFVTMLNKLAYSGTLPAKYRILDLYDRTLSPGPEQESVRSLRTDVRSWKISDGLGAFSEGLFQAHVNRAVVFRDRVELVLRCGLVLDEPLPQGGN